MWTWISHLPARWSSTGWGVFINLNFSPRVKTNLCFKTWQKWVRIWESASASDPARWSTAWRGKYGSTPLPSLHQFRIKSQFCFWWLSRPTWGCRQWTEGQVSGDQVLKSAQVWKCEKPDKQYVLFFKIKFHLNWIHSSKKSLVESKF